MSLMFDFSLLLKISLLFHLVPRVEWTKLGKKSNYFIGALQDLDF